jgi:hypothetical protein
VKRKNGEFERERGKGRKRIGNKKRSRSDGTYRRERRVRRGRKS